MRILAFDASARACSVAVIEKGKLLSEINLDRGSKHSEQLLPLIDQALKNARLKVAQMDLIALAAGPGSFTGVRIAAATGKALAQGLDKELVQINSLDALALNMPAEKSLVIPLLDARKNEFYSATYTYEAGKQIKIKDDRAINPGLLYEEVAASLAAGQMAYFLGEGAQACRTQIQEALGGRAQVLPENMGSIRASALARLAEEKYQRGEIASYYTLAPLYLRKPEAEISWEAKNCGR